MPRRLHKWLRGRHAARRGLILLYHRLTRPAVDPWGLSVSPERFSEHLSVLRRRAEVVPLSTLISSLQTGDPAAETLAVVTFDDGYADNLTHAAPVLEEHGVPATVFVVSGYVGSGESFWWDRLDHALLATRDLPERIDLELEGFEADWRPGAGENERRAAHTEAWKLLRALPPPRRDEAVARIAAACGLSSDHGCRPLSRDELRELDRLPTVEIGAHTASHPVLAQLEHAEQRREILGGKRDLEGMLGHPVQLFSYPHGQADDFTPETVELAREAGFSLACSAVGGLVTGSSDLYRLRRVAVPDCDAATFERRLDELLA